MQVDSDQDDVVIVAPSAQQLQAIQNQYLAETKRFMTSTAKYRLEYWYPFVAEHTFKTTNTFITALEAYSLTRMYSSNSLQPVHKQALQALKIRIDGAIANHFPQGCFAKLSTRSPKDYCWNFADPAYFAQMVDKVKARVKQLGLDAISQTRPLTARQSNAIYQTICNQSRLRILIKSADDFIKVFSGSDRISIDIANLLTCENYLEREFRAGNFQRGDLKLIDVCLREWVDFEWGNEFRCFYNNYRLTAITAYQQDCLFQQWLGKEDFISQSVKKFYEKIQPKLREAGLEQGVMDLAFSNDLQTVWLIEINTFDQNSRASLFSWQKDRQLLREGNCQVRIIKEYQQNISTKLGRIMGMMEKGSRQVVNQALKSSASKLYLP